MEKAKKEELEEFFNKHGYQLYKMGLTATGHEYYEKLRKDLYPELKNNLAGVPVELYKKSPTLARLSELQDIFAEKSTFSFIDTYFGTLTSYDLTLLDVNFSVMRLILNISHFFVIVESIVRGIRVQSPSEDREERKVFEGHFSNNFHCSRCQPTSVIKNE